MSRSRMYLSWKRSRNARRHTVPIVAVVADHTGVGKAGRPRTERIKD